MRDYAELIKDVRYCSISGDCAFCNRKGRAENWRLCQDGLLKDTADAIEELLAAVPKCGKWITTRTWEHDGEPYCSICEFEQSFTRFQKFKFCPNCGAKMEVSE